MKHLFDKSFIKSSSLSTPTLLIQYTEVNTKGEQISSLQLNYQQYNRIVVSNMPTIEDYKYCNVSPTEHYLKLHTVESNQSLINILSKKDENSLKTYLVQGGRRCDIGTIIIQSQNPNDTFPILVDERLFGQFRKIRYI